MSRRVLIVDDERSVREFLSILLEDEGFEVNAAEDVSSALSALDRGNFDLAICDLKLPDGSGLDILRTSQARQLDVPFIIITAHTTPQHAIDALHAGAAEYLSKPFDVEELKLIVDKVLTAQDRTRSGPVHEVDFVASSEPMRHIVAMIPRVAATPSTVLITGESGTGKELVAKEIHLNSARGDRAFATVNCGALPEGLLESELFGHVRGSFTGAVRDNPGMFAEAEGGTLFLDEIGELTLPMQVKLLRAIQARAIRPIGGTTERQIDVRVLAATNRDLQKSVAEGTFREDLYWRLKVIHLHLPPLRRRREDVPPLARHFVERTCERFGLPPKRLTSDAIRVLQAYPWPGNIRELENVIERTVAMEPSELISFGSLPEGLRAGGETDPLERSVLPEEGIDLEEHLAGVRRAMLRQALERTRGNQKEAASMLRLSYRAFRYHAEKLGLIGEDEA